MKFLVSVFLHLTCPCATRQGELGGSSAASAKWGAAAAASAASAAAGTAAILERIQQLARGEAPQEMNLSQIVQSTTDAAAAATVAAEQLRDFALQSGAQAGSINMLGLFVC